MSSFDQRGLPKVALTDDELLEWAKGKRRNPPTAEERFADLALDTVRNMDHWWDDPAELDRLERLHGIEFDRAACITASDLITPL